MIFDCRKISYNSCLISVYNPSTEGRIITWMKFVGQTTTNTKEPLFVPADEIMEFVLYNPDSEFTVDYEMNGRIYSTTCEDEDLPTLLR